MSSPQTGSVARNDDPPPYAWLDDPAQPFGPVGVVTTVVTGVGLLAVGLFAVVLGLVDGPVARGARIGTGLPIALIGAVIVRMGVARRAWRRRNPGSDPLEVARAAGANVGSAFGNGSWPARIGRWLLVLVSSFLAVVCGIALRNELTGPGTSPAVVVVIAALGALAAWTAWASLARSRAQRRR